MLRNLRVRICAKGNAGLGGKAGPEWYNIQFLRKMHNGMTQEKPEKFRYVRYAVVSADPETDAVNCAGAVIYSWESSCSISFTPFSWEVIMSFKMGTSSRQTQ